VNSPQKLTVQRPEDATPQPIPPELADRLDALPIGDGEGYWEVSRLVEYAYRLGYADGHARGYRDKDREVTVAKERSRSVDTTQGMRAVAAK
jgi:hypothetical protein